MSAEAIVAHVSAASEGHHFLWLARLVGVLGRGPDRPGRLISKRFFRIEMGRSQPAGVRRADSGLFDDPEQIVLGDDPDHPAALHDRQAADLPRPHLPGGLLDGRIGADCDHLGLHHFLNHD